MTAIGDALVGSPLDAELLEIDDGNELHVTAHGVSVVEVEQVFEDDPLWVPNKKGRTGNYLMVGRTNGNRPVTTAVVYDDIRRTVRPITAYESTDAEITRWRF